MRAVVRPLGRAALVLLVVGWLALPLLPVLLWAVSDRWSFPAVLPQSWGLSGWREAVGAGLPDALLRSVLLGLAVAAVATPLGVMLGRVLVQGSARSRRRLVGVLLVPLLLPPFAVSMGLDVLLLRTGVPAPLAVVLVLAAVALPYTAYVSATGYARIPPQLQAQARALGATPRQARWRVLLPAVRGSLVVAALLGFLVGWSDYVVTLVVGGGRLLTAPVLLGSAAAGSGNEAAVAAIALATLVPPVLLVLAASARTRGGGARRPITLTTSPAEERMRP